MKRNAKYLLVILGVLSLNTLNVTAEETTISQTNDEIGIQQEHSSGRDRYEEIIENSGDVIPGAPGSFDNENSTVAPETTQNIETTIIQTTLWEETTGNNLTTNVPTLPPVVVPSDHNQIIQEPKHEVNPTLSNELKKILRQNARKHINQSIWLTTLVSIPSGKFEYVKSIFLLVGRHMMILNEMLAGES